MRLRLGGSEAALSLLLLATAALLAPAKAEVPPGDRSAAEGAQELYLEVIIDGASTGLIAAFMRRADGSFEIAPGELEEIGLQPDASAMTEAGMVALDRLPGVTFAYEAETQTIAFTASHSALAPHRINAATASDTLPEPQADWGGVLNYTLFASAGGERWSDMSSFEGISGALDGRLFGPLGTLSATAVANSDTSEPYGLTRLDTVWSWSDPDRLLTYRAGDLVSGALTWTRPVRLGGVQVERNFGLRPDLVTLPLPEFDGTAAVPSTLDIFSDGGLVYSGPVAAGPFVADNIPVVTGAGRARVVLTDALGRETVTERAFYVSPGMLRPGFFDFSVEAGAPRRSYGTASSDYNDQWAASASVRYGLRAGFTLEAHAEASSDLLNAGGGGVFGLGAIGAGSLALAASKSADGAGVLANASLELGIGDASLYVRAQRAFGDYRDIAAMSADDGDLFDRLPPEALEQISASIPLGFDLGAVSLGASHIVYADGDESFVGTLSYSRPLPRNATLFATAVAGLGDDDRFGAYLGYAMPLGRGTNASAGVESDADGMHAVADVSRPGSQEPGSVGWRVRAAAGEGSDHVAGVSYRSAFGRVEASAGYGDAGARGTLQIDGAMLLAGGGVFATNRVDDSFAVVDVGAAGVEVLYENRPVGRTGLSGRLVVPGLRSWEANKIAIDPANLPIDAMVIATEEIVAPTERAGVTVDFGVKVDGDAAIVEFVLPEGGLVQAGSSGTLDGGESFIVGYDGEAFVSGLAARNAVVIVQPDGSACRAEFSYAPRAGEQVRILGAVCTPDPPAVLPAGAVSTSR